MKRRFGWLALLLVTACADPHARTQVMLELDAECGLLADADSIVLRVQGPDGEPSVITLEPSAAGPLPRRVPLLPAGDDANRTFLVEADLRSGALTLATVRAASGYRRGETLGLRLLFDDACRAHVCGATETCRAGTCESAARPPSSLSTFAPGAPACGAVDASVDGAVDAGLDASTDASTDAGPAHVLGVGCGSSHACATTSAGAPRCWGINDFMELGDGTTLRRDRPSDPVMGAGTAVSVAAGNFHSCALKASGGVTCWGLNVYGQLGNGTIGGFAGEAPSTVTTIDDGLAVAVGADHTCAVRSGGSLYCWGANDSGEIGNGNTSGAGVPAPTRVGLPEAVVAVALGQGHTCAAGTSGMVWCWGSDVHHELGGAPLEPGCSAAGVPGGSTPRPVPGLADVVALSAGPGLDAAYHTCALTRGSDVLCWGRNASGQLGDGTSGGDSSGPVPVMGVHDATAIAAGDNFTCALRGGSEVWCWGSNGSGQLGQPDTLGSSATPLRVDGLAGASALAAGGQFACALLDSGVRCWGANNQGQLGRGGTTASPVPMPVLDLP